MTITITIDDVDAQLILNNIALVKGWGDVTLETGRTKLGVDLRNEVRQLAVQGETQRIRDEEIKTQKQGYNAKITFT